MGPRELWLLLRIYCLSFITTLCLLAEMLMEVSIFLGFINSRTYSLRIKQMLMVGQREIRMEEVTVDQLSFCLFINLVSYFKPEVRLPQNLPILSPRVCIRGDRFLHFYLNVRLCDDFSFIHWDVKFCVPLSRRFTWHTSPPCQERKTEGERDAFALP